MMRKFCSIVAIVIIFDLANCQYTPDWESLDKRPLPLWFDDAKFGLFFHWGLYSTPSFGSSVRSGESTGEWFWWYWHGAQCPDHVAFMNKNFKPGFTMADFAPQFTADHFDPDTFASIIEKSGAKYFVLTSKHHEGYAMYKSNYTWNWNSVETGPKRDLVGELATAVRKTDVRFGVYFSQYEWFNTVFLKDRASGFKTNKYVTDVTYPQMIEIVDTYKPELIWSDGDWECSDTYWNSTNFLAWLYNESPVKDTIVVNDRWGSGAWCNHGGYLTCQDEFFPGHLMSRKWESCMTVDRLSWGFRRGARSADFLTIEELIELLASRISCGGNLLLNIGPTHDGRIIPIFEERLTQMGKFIEANKEAVYGTKPWVYQNDTKTPDIWYVSRLKNASDFDPYRVYNPQITDNTIVYAYVLKWPSNGVLTLGAPKGKAETLVTMLGYPSKLRYLTNPTGSISVDFTKINWRKLPNTWSWVLKFENLDNDSKVPDLQDPSRYAGFEKTKPTYKNIEKFFNN